MTQKRIALVTGSARGLGLAIAERLARSGASIVLCDVEGDAVRKTAAELTAKGIEAVGLEADVSDEGSVAKLFADIDKKFGRLDILVNNAGILGLIDGKRPIVEEMPLDVWKRTLDVNLTGTFLSCRGAIPLMKRGNWGRIVSISSRAARMRTGLGNSNYAASKGALIAFSRVLAGEVGRHGITVNCVAPSRVLTAMTLAVAGSIEGYFEKNIAETAVGRIAEPVDVANTIAFLCSDEASFLTGVVVDVSGGSFMA
jgi:NAD(P)-dependent dehydrogenase (short-subunit alcohol dehydrogenase family)